MRNSPIGTELKVDRHADLLTLTLNRPESSNALKPSLVEAMIDVLSQEQDIRLCVLKAEGKNFCAGFDLSDIEDLSDGDLLLRFIRIEHLLQKIHHAPYPVMALAQGHLIGAGADLFAACWQRVAAPNAKFRMPGWQFELALGTRRLTSLVGQDAARDLLIDSKTIDAKQALDIGLATDMSVSEEWQSVIDISVQRTLALPKNALRQMLDLTAVDTRSEDMASIANTAGIPGLKQRIQNYREKVSLARKVK